MTQSATRRSRGKVATEPAAEIDPLAESRALALRAAEILADTPASDTVVLDIHDASTLCDFFLLCSGENERQLKAITEEMAEQLNASGTRARRIEGSAGAGWIVLDYGDLIVHIFDVDQREFYGIEDLWASAPRLLSIQ